MKKLFVSVPMNGRTEEAIKRSITEMHKLAEIMFGEELELIDSYIAGNPPENSNQRIWYLGDSIKKLSEADRFIGIEYTARWNGCNIEHSIATQYGIKSTCVDLRRCEFLRDAAEMEDEFYNIDAVPVCRGV